MARYVISGVTGAAPSSTLPGVSLYAVANIALKVVRVQVSNTTATACYVALNRLTTAGTQGSGLTETKLDPDTPSASGTGFANHSVGPTVSDEIERFALGAAVGSGVVWTYDENSPLRIPAGTGNGIGILCPSGTGQVVSYTLEWLE